MAQITKTVGKASHDKSKDGGNNRKRIEKEGGMKTKYIVYYHCTILDEAIVRAYSPAEAQYIMEKRMKKRGDFEPKVDSVITEEEDQKLTAKRDFTGGPGYGY